ncbi:MAG: tRNA (adenosine(37)-N6)-threonylcarbamoyltransferase complex dimerization subunit type 1 TsaB [Acidobacteria bacterium]|nr:tRNA (adenosine(37)-N6)-threonylcarbamoyltransferase complex dimerization subunit type 1 TsaB [Acidobacteriota bacterium]
MLVLGVDTSTLAEGIGLVDEDAVIGEVNCLLPSTHSERLVSGIQTLLDRAGISPARLDGLAVACGPGSFTGLRIGMATVQGIALACDLPAVGFSTLEVMAHWCGSSWEGWVCPWMDAGRGEVYTGLFRVGPAGRVAAAEPEIASPPGVALERVPRGENCLFLGDGAARYRSLLAGRSGRGSGDRILPFHPFLGATAARLGSKDLPGRDRGEGLRPNYLRRPDAERNRAGHGS